MYVFLRTENFLSTDGTFNLSSLLGNSYLKSPPNVWTMRQTFLPKLGRIGNPKLQLLFGELLHTSFLQSHLFSVAHCPCKCAREFFSCDLSNLSCCWGFRNFEEIAMLILLVKVRWLLSHLVELMWKIRLASVLSMTALICLKLKRTFIHYWVTIDVKYDLWITGRLRVSEREHKGMPDSHLEIPFSSLF